MQYDVFISYSRHNMELADKVEASLRSNGLKCFVDRETIEIGEDWPEKIGKSIFNSEILLLLWTSESNQSENVAREVALATAYKKTVIPFQVGDFVPHYRLAYLLALVNIADKRQGYTDEELDLLTAKVVKSVYTARSRREELDADEGAPSKGSSVDGSQESKLNKIGAMRPMISPRVMTSSPQRQSADRERFEAEYALGCQKFRRYRLDEAFELLLEPALANYEKARLMLHYCISSTIRCRKVSERRFEELLQREELANDGFALYILGNYFMSVKNDYAQTYAYAVKSMNAGSDFGAMLYARCYEFGYGVEKNYEKVMPRLRRLALDGNELAMFVYGRNLLNGWNCDKDPELGLRIIREGAERGGLQCMELLADVYRFGTAVAVDEKRAEELYMKLIDMGWVEAYGSLGVMFAYNKDGSVRDMKRGLSCFMKGAELGEAGCMENLGLMYEHGMNGKSNLVLAIRWYKRAAEIGSRFAHLCLGHIYYYGKDEIPVDYAKAWEFYSRGAKLYSSWDSYYMLGLMYKNGCAPDGVTAEEAISYFEECIFGGGSFAGDAACLLYDIYHAGEWTPKDEQRGIDSLERAAEYGRECAMVKLGDVLTADIMSPYADEIKGIKYLTRAFEMGNVQAAILLAELYRKGMATVRDIEKSKEYLQFAISKEENAKALCEMGKLFAHLRQPGWDELFEEESELAVEQKRIDQKIAVEYLTRAAEKGYAEAYSCLASIGIDQAFADDIPDDEAEKIKTKIFEWSAEGAKLDHPQSMLDLGVLYQIGIGAETDIAKAEEWYKRACDKGSQAAPSSLASLYDEFYPRRASEAYYYALVALTRGHEADNWSELNQHCIERAKELESKAEGFDALEFADVALPRKMMILPTESPLVREMASLSAENLLKIIYLYRLVGEALRVKYSAEELPFVEELSLDMRLTDFVDNARLAIAYFWREFRGTYGSPAPSFFDREPIVEAISKIGGEQTRTVMAAPFELCDSLKWMYSVLNASIGLELDEE